jgi:hypothetical protein
LTEHSQLRRKWLRSKLFCVESRQEKMTSSKFDNHKTLPELC